jgi:hypothetical protein
MPEIACDRTCPARKFCREREECDGNDCGNRTLRAVAETSRRRLGLLAEAWDAYACRGDGGMYPGGSDLLYRIRAELDAAGMLDPQGRVKEVPREE